MWTCFHFSVHRFHFCFLHAPDKVVEYSISTYKYIVLPLLEYAKAVQPLTSTGILFSKLYIQQPYTTSKKWSVDNLCTNVVTRLLLPHISLGKTFLNFFALFPCSRKIINWSGRKYELLKYVSSFYAHRWSPFNLKWYILKSPLLFDLSTPGNVLWMAVLCRLDYISTSGVLHIHNNQKTVNSV